MKKLLVFLLIPLSLYADWGKTGHRVIGQIAQDNLSPNALAAITELLDGETLATVSTYADEIRSNPDFVDFARWHYVNLPLDKQYQDIVHEGDNIVVAIERCIYALEQDWVSKEQKAFHLKFLVHLIGDIHQPLHAGRKEDYGGNKIKVKWFGRDSNLHRVWDSEMINDYKMSYSELSNHLQFTRELNFDQNTPADWANESQELAKKVYETKVGEKLSYSYIYYNFNTVKDRLFQAGIRLANVLNEIYE